MHIENQVCTLDQARTLMELGIDQNIVNFYWMAPNSKDAFELIYNTGGYEWNDHPCYNGWPYRKAAYTVSEIHKMLPDFLLNEDGLEYLLSATKNTDPMSQEMCYTWGYYNFGTHKWYYAAGCASPIESAVELLVRLVNHSRTTVKEVNERLSGGL